MERGNDWTLHMQTSSHFIVTFNFGFLLCYDWVMPLSRNQKVELTFLVEMVKINFRNFFSPPDSLRILSSQTNFYSWKFFKAKFLYSILGLILFFGFGFLLYGVRFSLNVTRIVPWTLFYYIELLLLRRNFSSIFLKDLSISNAIKCSIEKIKTKKEK